MQAEDSRIKSLHQDASSHYLRGEFRQALEVWRSVLELDPKDERAREGVQLCELLADEGASAAAESSPAPPTAQANARPPFSEAAEGFDKDLDDLDEVLEKGLGSSPAGAEAKQETAEATEDGGDLFFEFSNVPGADESAPTGPKSADASSTAGEIDFGDVGESETLSVGGAPEKPVAIDPHSHAVDLPAGAEPAGEAAIGEAPPEELTPEEAAAKEEAQEAAAAELRSRVNELLAEALTAYEQDRKEDALAVLNRIFILDENNHAALALHDNIRVELEAEQAAATDASEAVTPIEGDEPAEPIDLAGSVDRELAEEELSPEAVQELAEAGPAPTESPIEEDFDEFEDEAAALADGGKKRRLLGEGLLTRQNVILVVILVVVVGAGGFLAYTFMGGSNESAAAPGDAAASVAAAGPVAPAVAVVLSEGGEETGPAAGPAAAAEAVPSEPAAPPQDPELLARRLESLVAQARQAALRGDWSAAVLAYNQALEIDPANTAARDELAQAGERYREERALEQRHQRAIEAFNEGNYRAALTLFYRLSPGEDGDRIDRYKRNGWYNMGIQALAVGDCKTATTHLNEARSVDAEDREVLLALDLAQTCPYSRDTEAYRDEVRQLQLRGLDD